MGKSTLVKQLRFLRSGPVYDADLEVKKLYNDKQVIKLLAEQFPETFENGLINKVKLTKVVQENPQSLLKLEAILYPVLRKNRRLFLLKMKRYGYHEVYLDIPLLYEKGWDKNCHEVLCVVCPDWLQQQRLRKRPGMTAAFLSMLKERQWPAAKKAKLATQVIQTGIGKAAAMQQLKVYFYKGNVA